MKDGKCSQCGPNNKYCMVNGGNAPEFCSTILYKEALAEAEKKYDEPENARFASVTIFSFLPSFLRKKAEEVLHTFSAYIFYFRVSKAYIIFIFYLCVCLCYSHKAFVSSHLFLSPFFFYLLYSIFLFLSNNYLFYIIGHKHYKDALYIHLLDRLAL